MSSEVCGGVAEVEPRLGRPLGEGGLRSIGINGKFFLGSLRSIRINCFLKEDSDLLESMGTSFKGGSNL